MPKMPLVVGSAIFLLEGHAQSRMATGICTCYVLYLPSGSKRNDSYPGWNNRGEAVPLESLKLQNPLPNAKKKQSLDFLFLENAWTCNRGKPTTCSNLILQPLHSTIGWIVFFKIVMEHWFFFPAACRTDGRILMISNPLCGPRCSSRFRAF